MAVWPRFPAEPSDRALAPLPETGPLRIGAFGSSLTLSGGWTEPLAERLTDCLGRPVEIDVVAKAGAGSTWALTQTDRVGAGAPQLVLMEFAINDADILDGVGVGTARTQHAALLDALATETPEAQVMLMTMNPVTGVVRTLQRPRLAAYYAMVRDLAAERGLALADLAPRWRAAWETDPALVPPDGLHPTPAANAAVTVPALASLIGVAAGADC